MKKILRKLISAFLAGAMLFNGVTASAEGERKIVDVKTISGYECYSYDGKRYYADIDGQEYFVLEIGETKPVTDPELLAQLNSLLGTDANLYARSSYPLANWPNMRDYDLSTGYKHSERVNLSNGNYHSPCFDVSLSYSENVALTVDYYNYLGTETKEIPTVAYYYIFGGWQSQSHTFGFNEAIRFHELFNGTSFSSIDKACFVMKKTSTNTGVFTYCVYEN